MAASTDLTVATAYIECALWASTGDDCEPLDATYSLEDFAPEAIRSMRDDVTDFLAACEREGIDLSVLTPEQIGHDFWLTRNRHGAGFWDRGLGAVGERLTALAHPYGDSYVYVGEDGRLYV